MTKKLSATIPKRTDMSYWKENESDVDIVKQRYVEGKTTEEEFEKELEEALEGEYTPPIEELNLFEGEKVYR